ncbi:MAG: hypothetical protein GX629_06145 [Phycisphaerae bacterium]|jgi:hypothetical protein|nr:hypothetical protein [Phycisphaerae bacterium]
MKTTALLICSVLLFVGSTGCQQPIRQTTPPSEAAIFYEDIVWVTLSLERPFLDDDNDRIPDGVLVRAMLNRPNEKSFVAGKGTLIIHLIKRTRNEQGIFHDKEMYTWTINEEDFERAVVRQRYGIVCHQMAIYWYGVNPRGPGWYLQAEFIRTDKQRVVSRLISLTIPEKM